MLPISPEKRFSSALLAFSFRLLFGIISSRLSLRSKRRPIAICNRIAFGYVYAFTPKRMTIFFGT